MTTMLRLYGPPTWELVPKVTRAQLLRRVAFYASASPQQRLELGELKDGQVLDISDAHRRTIAGSEFIAVRLASGVEHVCPASSVKLLP